MLIVGIDPGATGAIALFFDCDVFHIHDMPVDVVKVGKTMRKRVNPWTIAAMFRHWDPRAVHVFKEKVGPSFKDGPAGAFAFGAADMAVTMACAAFNLPFTEVEPELWKRVMGCPTDKGLARRRACQLLPEHAASFARVKDDGRAEAAMIGLYGVQMIGSL